MDKYVNLSWKNHNTILSSIIHEYRVNNTFCDVTVACCGKFFPLHRLVLSTFSDYFKDILELAPCKHPFIIVQDIPLEDLQVLLDFIYIGEVAVLSDRVPTLLKAALKLRIRGLSNSLDIDLEKESLESNYDLHSMQSNLGDYMSYEVPRHTPKKKKKEMLNKNKTQASFHSAIGKNIYDKPESIIGKDFNVDLLQPKNLSPSSSTQISSKMNRKRQKIYNNKKAINLINQKQIFDHSQLSYDLMKPIMKKAQVALQRCSLADEIMWRNKVQGPENTIENMSVSDSSKKDDQEIVYLDEDDGNDDNPLSGGEPDESVVDDRPSYSSEECNSLGKQQNESINANASDTSHSMTTESSSVCPVDDLNISSPDRHLKQESNEGELERSAIKVENEELFNNLEGSESPVCYLNPELKLDILDGECRIQTGNKEEEMSLIEREHNLQRLLPMGPTENFATLNLEKGDKPFKCNICPKEFKVRSSLKGHKLIHSDERPFICPYCGKLFRQSGHLQQHKRIHTGEKPYRCTFCNKFFRQKAILNQHLRLHTGEKPYVCMDCGLQFRQKATLDSHYQTHISTKFNLPDFNFATSMAFPHF